MKIVFLCGSLEPGMDGVGDYTRRLAAELIKIGHLATMISLNDTNCGKFLEAEQEQEGIFIHTLRLGKGELTKIRYARGKRWIDDFDPDWISLQYVPNSFNKKGLPWKLGSELSKIGVGRNWHIMFHELWVGISKISPVKHRVLGFFQQIIAQKIINKLKPQLISTSNDLYQLILSSKNINSGILPLFSNIPVADIDKEMKSYILSFFSIEEKKIKDFFIAGIFGTLHPEAKLGTSLKTLELQSEKTKQKLIFLSFGRIGSYGKEELERLKGRFSGKIEFLHLGEQSPNRISTILQLLDIGISCTPLQHIAKSGVYAAMKLHGLKVLVSGYEYLPEYDKEIKQHYQKYETKPGNEWSVEWVAENYLSQLKSKSGKLRTTKIHSRTEALTP